MAMLQAKFRGLNKKTLAPYFQPKRSKPNAVLMGTRERIRKIIDEATLAKQLAEELSQKLKKSEAKRLILTSDPSEAVFETLSLQPLTELHLPLHGAATKDFSNLLHKGRGAYLSNLNTLLIKGIYPDRREVSYADFLCHEEALGALKRTFKLCSRIFNKNRNTSL